MSEFVFTSAGVKFRERDLTFVARSAGITTLGIAGETPKGAAFEPVLIEDAGQFRTRFGDQSTEKFPNGDLKYLLPYYANAYLSESNQLYVTRVLGLSGYDAGTAWNITLSAGVDPSTTGETTGVTVSTGINFTNNRYLGITLTETGQTGSVFTGFTKTSPTGFTGVRFDFEVTSITGTSGTVDQTGTTITGVSYTEYENMVLATVRSRATVEDVEDASPVVTFDAETVDIVANNTDNDTGDIFGEFTLRATNTDVLPNQIDLYTVSLDPSSRSYIANVLGTRPKGKDNQLWVEAVYPDLIKKLDADGIAYGVNSTLIEATTDAFTNYQEQYQTPETPWIVSELRGSDIIRLFKFISISDGNAANREIKITLQNIDPISKEFDVVIRDFNDTDENIVVLESFTRCSMIRGENNYLGNRIGTSNGDYPLRSEYVMLEIADDLPNDVFPAGFEGYMLKDYSGGTTGSATDGIAPKIFYKQSYDSDDRLTRTYLGISEKAYNGTGLVGTGINQNLFNYNGQSGFFKSKGFHMDSGATGTYYVGTSGASTLIGTFETGAGQFRTIDDINSSSDVYFERASRKFTLVPAGGFDGWNEHRNERSTGDLYREGGIFDGVADGVTPSNDYQAYLAGIRTYANPERVTINLFTTPNINWSDNLRLVNETIRMIEQERTDTLYVIDAPDITLPESLTEETDQVVARDIVDSLDATGIDSSYAATYYPWIQITDAVNNVRLFIPPTGEVLKAMAFTDNVRFPWFAPAGLQRGVIDANRSKYRFSLDARDTLYAGRINPIVDFPNTGTAIFGQKTLQVRESALDRINVRRLLLQTKVLISNIAIRLVFEQNDQTTIDEFLSKTNPILENIRRERGLQEFRVVMDDSNNSDETRDRNELYGEILLKPTRAVEYIGLTFTITPSGASFDDI